MEINETEHNKRLTLTVMTRGRDIRSFDIECFFEPMALGDILKPGSAVLEVGCGFGHTLYGLTAKYGILPFGLDLENFLTLPEGFADTKEYRYTPLEIFFRQGNATKLPWKDNHFDFAYSYMTMIYVLDKLKAVQEIHRVINVGSKALVNMEESPDWHGTIPELSTLVAENSNDGQLEVVKSRTAHHLHFDNSILINKRSEGRLQFPTLRSCSYHYEKAKPPFVISDYRAEKKINGMEPLAEGEIGGK